MLLRDGECFLSRVTLAEANQSELLSEHPDSGVCDTNRLRVNGRRRSHACFCVISLLRLSRVMLRWMMLTGGVCVCVCGAGGFRHLQSGCELMDRVQASFFFLWFRVQTTKTALTPSDAASVVDASDLKKATRHL